MKIDPEIASKKFVVLFRRRAKSDPGIVETGVLSRRFCAGGSDLVIPSSLDIRHSSLLHDVDPV
jgi:hypothetical protein